MHQRLRPRAAGLLALLLALTSLALAAAAVAESTPEAQQWIDKLAAIYGRPFEVDMEMDMGSASAPMPVSDFRGHLVQQDRRHMRMAMSMTVTTPQGELPMKMTMVLDGTVMWNEMDMAMGKQVTKIDLDEMEAMAEEQGLGSGTSQVDPFSQLEKLAGLADFEVASNAGGEVILRGTLKEEGQVSFGGAAPPGAETVTLVFDEATGFPKRMAVGGDEPIVEMRFANLKFLDAAAIPAGTFAYTPPEGVPVIDVAATMRGREALDQQTAPDGR